jgi:hypothetical protein
VIEDVEAESFDGGTERWLRHALENERQRSRDLQGQLDQLKSSESFRIAQAISVAARYRLGRSLRFLIPRRHRRRLLGEAEPLPAQPAQGRTGASGGVDTVVFISIEGDANRGHHALDQIEMLTTMLVAVRPVVVSDVPDPERWADRRLVIEHVIPYAAWVRFRPAAEWGAYVAERIASVIDEYAARRIITLSAFGPAPATSAAMLAPVILPAMGRSHSNQV